MCGESYVHSVPAEAGDVAFLGDGVTAGCELPGMGAGNQIQVLWESGMHYG